MFQKKPRIKDPDLIEVLKKLPCYICKKPPPSDVDHVKTLGSGGGDTLDNLWPLCRFHHSEKHAKGLMHMIRKYPDVRRFLEDHDRQDLLDKLKRIYG